MSLGRRVLRCLFFSREFRRRIATFLAQEHPEELGLGVAIPHGLRLPVFDDRYSDSFNEIFLHQIYRPLLDALPPPVRWLDLGAHAGFFSLWLLLNLRRRGVQTADHRAVLVDADPGTSSSVGRIIELNGLRGNWTVIEGAIGDPSGPAMVRFILRGIMASSLAHNNSLPGRPIDVRVVRPEEIAQLAQQGFDLVKVDIEGAETEFLRHYGPVLRLSRAVIMEWHARERPDQCVDRLTECARAQGFSRVDCLRAGEEHMGMVMGTLLLRRD